MSFTNIATYYENNADMMKKNENTYCAPPISMIREPTNPKNTTDPNTVKLVMPRETSRHVSWACWKASGPMEI